MRVLLAIAVLLAAPATARAGELELTGSTRLSDRLTELTFTTDALNAPTHVRVLTPAGYDPAAKRRYPMLFLLHGSVDDYKSWTDKGDAERITTGLPLIVVMPDAGAFGNYTDWFNDGAFGPPEWERFHIHQLLPWIDAHYRTVGRRRGRAVAGLSMGGGGTMKYAAAHPDLFTAAYAFSPAVDTSDPPLIALAQASGVSDGSRSPGSIYGLRATQEVRWHNENPTDLAENFAPLQLGLLTGDGRPGGPDGSQTFDPIEEAVHRQSLTMHAVLGKLGIPHLFDDYGAGGHQWYDWQRDLRKVLPLLMDRFALHVDPPRRVTYTRADPDYAVFGWKVHVERPAMEFSTLRGASRRGFSLAGSGVGTVRTPAFYRPRQIVRVTLDGKTSKIAAGPGGRLRLSVPLGPGNRAQQYTAGAVTKTYVKRVRLRPVRRTATGSKPGR